jgi:hypothetical protein
MSVSEIFYGLKNILRLVRMDKILVDRAEYESLKDFRVKADQKNRAAVKRYYERHRDKVKSRCAQYNRLVYYEKQYGSLDSIPEHVLKTKVLRTGIGIIPDNNPETSAVLPKFGI